MKVFCSCLNEWSTVLSCLTKKERAKKTVTHAIPQGRSFENLVLTEASLSSEHLVDSNLTAQIRRGRLCYHVLSDVATMPQRPLCTKQKRNVNTSQSRWRSIRSHQTDLYQERQAQRMLAVRCTQHEISDWLGRYQLILACLFDQVLTLTATGHRRPNAPNILPLELLLHRSSRLNVRGRAGSSACNVLALALQMGLWRNTERSMIHSIMATTGRGGSNLHSALLG